MRSETAPGRTKTLLLHRKLYRAKAIAAAIEAARDGEHEIRWNRSGADGHHEIVITGPSAEHVADQIAQSALEDTIVSDERR